jgi:hypothetical protein
MFSERQRVVVIDDNYEEVKNLLSALWKKRIPYVYLNGQMEKLPEVPFSGVRLIFIDIVLDMESPSAENNAAPVANVISKIVGQNPGPYFVVFWTKHDNLIKEVLRYLGSVNISPVGHIDLEKPAKSDDGPTVAALISRLEEKLFQLEAFNYILEWERLIEEAVHNFSANLFSVIPPDGNNAEWSKRIKSILGKLALSYTGKSELANNENDIRNAFLTLTDSFKDTLQQIIKTKRLDYTSELSRETLTLEQVAKLNSSLFIDFHPDDNPEFGNVFFVDQSAQTQLNEAISNSVKLRMENRKDAILVGMIITPSCDLANRKYLHNGEDCFRILYGLLVPVIMDTYKHKQEADFTMEPFWYYAKGKPYQLIFHFGSLSSIWWKKAEIPKFEFSIKEHLSFDIQSKMASHANRLGNSMLQSP